MFFKHLIIYRLSQGWNVSAANLEEALERRLLQPCGSLDMQSRGWVPATRQGLVYTQEGQHLVALGVNQKILPASVVRQVVQERAAEVEKQQGFPVGRRQMRELKEQVTVELRAQALVRRRVTRAWIDPLNGWLVVDAAGAAQAEEVTQELRDSLGTFAVTLLETEHSTQHAMDTWIRAGEAPAPFVIDTDLELQAIDESKSTVRYARHSLEGQDIQTHLSTGKVVTRLGLTWNDRITFVLTKKLEVKRVKFLSVEADSDDRGSELPADDRFERDFQLMSGELAQLLSDLTKALRNEPQHQALAA